MPNPFPGMNPYLENPRRWRDVHGALIYRIRDALVAHLPPAYAAIVEERVYVQTTFKNYVPDALIIERISPFRSRPEVSGGTAAATLTRPEQAIERAPLDAPHTLFFENVTLRERFIEVRTGDALEMLVAVIELLSPKNKTSGAGRDEYQRKQSDMLNSDVHFLEIDLLRGGAYSLAPPESEVRERLGAFDYLISLHRAFAGGQFDLWPLTVRDRLPRLLLPLGDWENVVLDLQTVLNEYYDASGQSRLLDYSKPPIPPLSPDDAKWVSDLMNQAENQAEQAGTLETKDL